MCAAVVTVIAALCLKLWRDKDLNFVVSYIKSFLCNRDIFCLHVNIIPTNQMTQAHLALFDILPLLYDLPHVFPPPAPTEAFFTVMPVRLNVRHSAVRCHIRLVPWALCLSLFFLPPLRLHDLTSCLGPVGRVKVG